MTMHLEGPWLSMGGKRKGKTKFRNAEQARLARELEADWTALKKRHGVEDEERRRARAMKAEPLTYKLSAPPGRETVKIKSLDTGVGIAAKKAVPQYTGTKMIGIGVMHKSNSVPVFSDDEAKDISRMRRG